MAMPRIRSTMPASVRDKPRRLYGWGVKWYGIIRNHSGFSTVITVSRRPPTKSIAPIMVIRYPMVSLCLDSSAFSWRYSLKSIKFTIFGVGRMAINIIADSEFRRALTAVGV